MGAARDFDQDENLDFSDLSDTNQSALEKAKSRWGNAEVIRGNDLLDTTGNNYIYITHYNNAILIKI